MTCGADYDWRKEDKPACRAGEAIEYLRKEARKADTAFLAGVKAGLDAAKYAVHDAAIQVVGDEAVYGLSTAANIISEIEPTTIKPTSAGEGGDGPSADGDGVV
jgi:hypothetical protein